MSISPCAEKSGEACECRTTQRRLAVIGPQLFDQCPDLVAAAEAHDAELFVNLHIICVDVGPAGTWTTVEEFANFVRALVRPDQFAELRAAWINVRSTLESQLPVLLNAEMLSTLARPRRPELLECLEAARIRTWYQPIIDAETGGVWGHECLMRPEMADGQIVSPFEMITWARTENLVFMLDRVSRETHLRNAGKADIPLHEKILINFLPTSIYRPDFCLKSSMAAAREGNLDPGRIIFEVIESEEVTDHEHLRGVLAYYRRNGFGVALDDVGTGFAGLTLLADLNPDLIKIARELVVAAEAPGMHRSLIKSLIQACKENGKLVLAEGVETEAQCAYLSELDVDLFQGFYFGRPAPTPASAALAGVV